jgi:TPR repeat protein
MPFPGTQALRVALPVILAGLLLAALPARAQFYDLDGKYRCLTASDAACAKELRDRPPPPPPPPPPKPPPPSLEEITAHVRGNTVTTVDIETLKERHAAKDTRAMEILAWCQLNGLGMPKDPLGAYWLYGEAAALGVETAKHNQGEIYKANLTPKERQEVLLRENAAKKK